jgi:hypothetical protein
MNTAERRRAGSIGGGAATGPRIEPNRDWRAGCNGSGNRQRFRDSFLRNAA